MFKIRNTRILLFLAVVVVENSKKNFKNKFIVQKKIQFNFTVLGGCGNGGGSGKQ